MLGFVGMDETKKMETHLTSAAAFVEGGIQDACDDACSICLEAFCDSDPSTVKKNKMSFLFEAFELKIMGFFFSLSSGLFSKGFHVFSFWIIVLMAFCIF